MWKKKIEYHRKKKKIKFEYHKKDARKVWIKSLKALKLVRVSRTKGFKKKIKLKFRCYGKLLI